MNETIAASHSCKVVITTQSKKEVHLNMFWLNKKSLSATFAEFIQDRIVENKFKKEIGGGGGGGCGTAKSSAQTSAPGLLTTSI